MKKIIKLGLGALSLAALVSSCSKKNVGPDLIAASPQFAVTTKFQASNKGNNFNIGINTKFSAKFNETVTWKLVVEGLSSGAKKVYKGNSAEIKADNTEWKGYSNEGLPFFRASEKAIGKLYITGHDKVYLTDTIDIGSGPKYHGETINGIQHIVVEGFEGGDGNGPLQSVAADQKDINQMFEKSTVFAVEGANSYHMKGQDLNDNYWCGDISHAELREFVKVSETDKKYQVDSLVKPEDLYFNIFVYGTGATNSAVQITAFELDHAPSKDSIINFGKSTTESFKTKDNDAWFFNTDISWKGWKMLTIPYSSFKPKSDLNAGGAGNRVKEPWKIVGMAVSLNSSPASGAKAEAYVDFFVVTVNGALQR